VGVDPTTSGGTAFPEAGSALGLRVGSALALDFFFVFLPIYRGGRYKAPASINRLTEATKATPPLFTD